MELNDKNTIETLWFYKLETIIGKITIIKSENGLRSIDLFDKEIKFNQNKITFIESEDKCKEEINQLIQYFNGERKSFNLTLDIEGTDFRKMVWNELLNVPYGEVRSYKDIAIAIGNEKAVRAIGQANKANPIPIIIPCHRVIGKNDKLIGYAGNHTDIQSKLIDLEKNFKLR